MSWKHCGRHGPIFKTHQKAHQAVLANEAWFGDGKPVIGKQFTAEKTKERKAEVVALLYRTAGQERRASGAGVADQLATLADKIFYCKPPWRCGSLACPECHRAFQKEQRWPPKGP
jgi:hypothetical protein